ncbi:MAG: Lrp/AsnC family transcriptional regulator [Thaumarchaeota archaeon]|nr:Lrp/AsnC family transcriptional regulator [Nitrososphaerota archaeon]
MDSKDFHLLVGLHENARQSFRSLGKKISLSAPAVRERLNNLENRGILQGYWLSIDPNVFEREDVLIFFSGDRTTDDARKALEGPDVAWVARKVDGGLTVQVWSKESRSNQPRKDLETILGTKSIGQAFSDRHALKHRLSSVDWQIIEALIDDPRMSFSNLVKLTDLSPKTVRNHLERLLEDEVMYILPKLGALSDSGELVFQLTVYGKVGLAELRKVLGDVFLINTAQDPPLKYMLCSGTDLGDVTVKTNQLKKILGVESVIVSLNREIIIGTGFIRSLVHERLENQNGEVRFDQDLEKMR